MKIDLKTFMIEKTDELMDINPLYRLPIILTALDYTMEEMELTYDDIIKLRKEVDFITGGMDIEKRQ